MASARKELSTDMRKNDCTMFKKRKNHSELASLEYPGLQVKA